MRKVIAAAAAMTVMIVSGAPAPTVLVAPRYRSPVKHHRVLVAPRYRSPARHHHQSHGRYLA